MSSCGIVKDLIITDCFFGKYLLLLLGCVMCIGCTKKNQMTSNPELLQVEEKYSEEQYRNSYLLFNEIDTTNFNQLDKMVWYLYEDLFHLKKYHTLTSTHNILIPYFVMQQQYRYAGQTCLIEGIYLTWSHKEEEAMNCFKQAESYFAKDSNTPSYLLCELYYRMALCYKATGLYQQSDLCNQKTIMYGKEACFYSLVSSAYKMLGNTQINLKSLDTIPQQEVINLYDSAIYYHNLVPHKYIGNYHNICYNKALYLSDSANILYHGKYLVDSCDFLVPASSIASYYLRRNKLDSAWIYIQKLATDTLTTNYNKRRSNDAYESLMAFYLQESGKTLESSKRFQALAHKYYERADMTERDRTYMISRQYDVEKAQREVLELKVEKQHLWIVVLMSIGVICLIALIFLIYRERWRRKIIIQEQQINALNEELEIKRTNLKQKLMQRIDFARQMNIQQMKDNNSMNEIPTWVKKFIDTQLLFDGRKGKILCQEFNSVYYNMLDVLKAEYPDISQSELMICVLIILQLSITDICVLLDMPRRTVWNKRNLIKEHIGLGLDDDLDQWLHNYAIQVALRSK